MYGSTDMGTSLDVRCRGLRARIFVLGWFNQYRQLSLWYVITLSIHDLYLFNVCIVYIYIYPPSNFSYEMGRTWATGQIASQDFFVQTGGVVPPILYLESFCSWFLSNHHFHFVVVYVELVEASNIKSQRSEKRWKRWKKGNSAWHVHGHKQIMKLQNAI